MIRDRLDYLLNRLKRPPNKQGRLPNTDLVAGLNKEDRKSASNIAKRLREQFDRGLDRRLIHAIKWTQVLSVLNGIHYFKIDKYGRWSPVNPREPNQVRAVVPVLEPFYRWEHGRLSSNQLGVVARPSTGHGDSAYFEAQLAQDAMNYWVEETDIASVDDEANQHLLVYGGCAFFSEKVAWRNQVFLRAFPFCELFPIPYDSRNWVEMDGVARIITVSKDWLEMQDEAYRRRTGHEPSRRMTDLAGTQTADMHANFTGFTSSIQYKSKFDGATCMWIWMKPTELNPFGEHLFMVEDELFGYVSGVDQEGRKIALVGDELPLFPVHYNKKPHDWWPYGFCETLVPMQLEHNRQMSNLVESANRNKGVTAYNSACINANDVQNAHSGFIPFRAPGPDERIAPLLHFPPTNVGRDVGAVLQVCDQFAKQGAGYQSDILFGQQEGRTESGPATQILNTNAQMPMQVVLDRKWRALRKAYRAIYEDIRQVWPPEKHIRLEGADGLAREAVIQREKLPALNEIELSPMPLVVNGRVGMINMLFNLRGMKGDDQQAPIVSETEFRRSLQMLGMAPPGMVLYDQIEQRIRWRISQLIGDGKSPTIPVVDQDPVARRWQRMEHHILAIRILKEKILDPAFRTYSPEVRQALELELKYHHSSIQTSPQPDLFDDQADRHEAMQMEAYLEAAENNPEDFSSVFAPSAVTMA